MLQSEANFFSISVDIPTHLLTTELKQVVRYKRRRGIISPDDRSKYMLKIISINTQLLCLYFFILCLIFVSASYIINILFVYYFLTTHFFFFKVFWTLHSNLFRQTFSPNRWISCMFHIVFLTFSAYSSSMTFCVALIFLYPNCVNLSSNDRQFYSLLVCMFVWIL